MAYGAPTGGSTAPRSTAAPSSRVSPAPTTPSLPRLLAGWLLILASSAACAQAALFDGRVVAVLDGDTIDVLVVDSQSRQTNRVRLAEIDAPEKGQPFWRRSKQSLSEVCFDRPARVRIVTIDRYGRLVGRVWCDGLDANAHQVEAGMAWFFTRYGSDPAIQAAEHYARERGHGLWSDPHPVPPWVWRQMRRRD